MTVDEALDAIEALQEMIETLASERPRAYDAGLDFFETITEQSASMASTLEDMASHGRDPTPGQVRAIKNWTEGVQKWFW